MRRSGHGKSTPRPAQLLAPLEVSRQRDPALTGHVHPHLELNYLFSGSMRYRLAGRLHAVPSGRWAMFWAALPHALEGCAPGTDSLALAIPVGIAQGWPGTAALLRRLMLGELLLLPAEPAAAHAAERWCREATDAQRRPLVLLEIEAMVRRAALSPGAGDDAAADGVHPLSRAFGQMIALLHRDLSRPCSLAELAAAAGLRPDTASRLFHRHAGCSLRAYQQRLRVGEARRLLLEGDLPILDVAMRCGYASLSRFYAAYVRVYAETPVATRRHH